MKFPFFKKKITLSPAAQRYQFHNVANLTDRNNRTIFRAMAATPTPGDRGGA
ncbi:hypothetical protein [Pseudoduganella chitinolytica]|uniref:Uncharacterized protein n=1 Tax=Pseudoduganella chitinolytica TaxID=34070 RepID=A0ABY8BC24_9BURK|nr:hypothetical protein [Pseudoduganella chitinolytica]WEF33452.1 hypothetical protein PX653_01280 [Pseudoduganella chitinolytica]